MASKTKPKKAKKKKYTGRKPVSSGLTFKEEHEATKKKGEKAYRDFAKK